MASSPSPLNTAVSSPSSPLSSPRSSANFPTLRRPGHMPMRRRVFGILEISVIQARNIGREGKPCRPYCVVEFENNEHLTKEAGPNYVWNDTAKFDASRMDSELTVTVWDRAKNEDGKNEDFLGSCTIRPTRADTVQQKNNEVWFKLKGRQWRSINGDILLSFRFQAREYKPLTIDDFQLLHVIGRGNFGKVIAVRKIDTGRIYAMKILRKERIIQRDEIEHIISERNVLVQNDSPFLVQLKYAFQTPEKLYLVLDYKNGGELFHHMQRENSFTEDRAKFYAAELVLALQALHQYGVIYRDLKPENVLLDSNGHMALTDFGLCKEQRSPDDNTDTFCGTAEYLAPEVLKGEGYGRAVDWWSLGILLYEMITGLPPFFSENVQLMYKKILYGELTFPPTMTQDAMSILNGLLTRDPELRLGSGPEDAEEIRRHPFFGEINWAQLSKKMISPPFKPVVKSSTDVSNFDSVFTSEAAVDSVTDHSPLPSDIQEKFKGFTFTDSLSIHDSPSATVSS